MNDKTSQKTDDGVLNQTFGGYDDDMTMNGDGQTVTGESSASPVAKKKSNLAYILIIIGIVALVITAYLFFKPAAKKRVASPPPSNQVEQTQTAANTTPPATTNTIPEVADSPERAQAKQFLTEGTSPVTINSGNVPVTVNPSTVPVIVNPSNMQEMPAINPMNPSQPNQPTQQQFQPTVDNSAAIVNQVSRDFEVQSQQFKLALDSVDGRVTELEKFRGEQISTNKNVNERLVKLESNGVRTNTSVIATPAKTVRRVTRRSEPRESRDSQPAREAYVKHLKESNVLVDKTESRPSTPAVQDYNVHSIYGGRVWLKNTDGSLSTFTSGDKLPNGETIKQIDDDKFSITTDKRTFVKK